MKAKNEIASYKANQKRAKQPKQVVIDVTDSLYYKYVAR